MHKCYKSNKRGFTLIEMILVIAIIVVLASVVALSVNGIITKSKAKSNAINDSRDEVTAAKAAGENQLSVYSF